MKRCTLVAICQQPIGYRQYRRERSSTPCRVPASPQAIYEQYTEMPSYRMSLPENAPFTTGRFSKQTSTVFHTFTSLQRIQYINKYTLNQFQLVHTTTLRFFGFMSTSSFHIFKAVVCIKECRLNVSMNITSLPTVLLVPTKPSSSNQLQMLILSCFCISLSRGLENIRRSGKAAGFCNSDTIRSKWSASHSGRCSDQEIAPVCLRTG